MVFKNGVQGKPRDYSVGFSFASDFSRDTLFCLYNEVSYPDRTRSARHASDTLRQECDERTGEYPENQAGKDRDPLE